MFTVYNLTNWESYTLSRHDTKTAAIGKAISWKTSLAGIKPCIAVVDDTTGEVVWGL